MTPRIGRILLYVKNVEKTVAHVRAHNILNFFKYRHPGKSRYQIHTSFQNGYMKKTLIFVIPAKAGTQLSSRIV